MSYIVPQKMPLRCFECGHISLSTIDGYGCKIAHKSIESEPGINVRRPDWCPLVEIPTPHGRLIDADKLKSRLVLDNDSNELQRISADILKWIDIQETVIEGSET